MSGGRILVVEDDPDVWHSLQILLSRAGYQPTWASDGVAGLERFAEDHPHLVVLDLGLPALDGWTVLERMRQLSNVPVLMLTGRGLEEDKVRGLLGGADDYLTKPFGNDELVARVGALLRRSPAETGPAVYDDGVVLMGFDGGRVEVDGESVSLSPTEFRLLDVLVRHAGSVVTYDRLLREVWHQEATAGRSRVKHTVLGLRRKLGWSDAECSPIQTVRGFGYRYALPKPAAHPRRCADPTGPGGNR